MRSAAELRLQLAQGKVDYSVGTAYNRQMNVGAGQRGDSVGLFLSVPLGIWNRNQGEIERARQEELLKTIRKENGLVESFIESARRHRTDARHLAADQRYQNGGHLIELPKLRVLPANRLFGELISRTDLLQPLGNGSGVGRA